MITTSPSSVSWVTLGEFTRKWLFEAISFSLDDIVDYPCFLARTVSQSSRSKGLYLYDTNNLSRGPNVTGARQLAPIDSTGHRKTLYQHVKSANEEGGCYVCFMKVPWSTCSWSKKTARLNPKKVSPSPRQSLHRRAGWG